MGWKYGGGAFDGNHCRITCSCSSLISNEKDKGMDAHRKSNSWLHSSGNELGHNREGRLRNRRLWWSDKLANICPVPLILHNGSIRIKRT